STIKALPSNPRISGKREVCGATTVNDITLDASGLNCFPDFGNFDVTCKFNGPAGRSSNLACPLKTVLPSSSLPSSCKMATSCGPCEEMRTSLTLPARGNAPAILASTSSVAAEDAFCHQ